ncbi:glutamate decarboxylase [Elysia marginata]|uniref:Glutamate decarboxylase n=1 Tax=Elysia marginata TaxID=1093978 RepID=A0AAV4J3G2_9GAST|nr:glutamate decarboxylase [Elysia marginata]
MYPISFFSSYQPNQLAEMMSHCLDIHTEGRDLEQLLSDCKETLKYCVKTGHPHFLNQLSTGVDVVGVAGAWLAAAVNTNMFTYEAAPVFTLMEEVVLSRMRQLIGWQDGEAMFAPGGGCRRCYKSKVVYIEWPDNSSSKISIPTGKYSTNYKAEAEALQEAAKVLVNSEATHHAKVVLLTDARSVLDARDSTKCPEVNALAQAITTLSLTASKLVLQWIPGHVDIFGNDVADQLAKEGGMMEQIQHNPSDNEARTLINSALDCHCRQEHPQYNSKDAIHKLSRAEQVTIFRLRTGHNRLKHHLF